VIGRQFEKIRRTIWTFKQPLTRHPKQTDAQVSDLFVWRNSDEWQTYFELLDIPGLFAERKGQAGAKVRFVFFDLGGGRVGEANLDVVPAKRQTVSLANLLPPSAGVMGTFCVLHATTPTEISQLGSFIAERGYVSYSYSDAPLRAYVHGNLDAIALLSGQKLELLGAVSMLQREYRLQCYCDEDATYEFALVNPTPRRQKVNFSVVSIDSGGTIERKEIELAPGGADAFCPRVSEPVPFRLIIKSHLVMARPLVFRIKNSQLDVFHG